MENFYKKLPRGWRYLLTQKEIRAFLESTPGDIRLVKFGGLAYHGHGKWKAGDSWNAGEISVRGTVDGWKYKIELNGLPDELVGGTRPHLCSILLSGMASFISEFESKGLDPSAKTEDLRFFHRDREGVLDPDYGRWKLSASEHKVERPWWL